MQKKFFKKNVYQFLFLLTFYLSPFLIKAQEAGNLIPDCGSSCGYNDFMALINNVVYFVLFRLAVPIAAIMFAYAGILLLTSGGQTSQREKAKKIFWNVALGLIIAVGAWLIVNTILSILGYENAWIVFKK